MSIRWFLFAFVVSTGLASAEPAPNRAPRRRAAKLDQQRSSQEKKGKVHVLTEIVVPGRDQRPMAVIDLTPQRFQFSVGTARYSTTDRVHVPASAAERW